MRDLQHLGVDCHIGGAFAAAIAYANVSVLSSPSLVGMHHVCLIYVQSYLLVNASFKFNIDKYVAAECGNQARNF